MTTQHAVEALLVLAQGLTRYDEETGEILPPGTSQMIQVDQLVQFMGPQLPPAKRATAPLTVLTALQTGEWDAAKVELQGEDAQ